MTEEALSYLRINYFLFFMIAYFFREGGRGVSRLRNLEVLVMLVLIVLTMLVFCLSASQPSTD
jgi:hypothetical protein